MNGARRGVCPANSRLFRRPPADRPSPPRSACQGDGADMTPVIALMAVDRPAVAEKPRLVGIGAVPEILDRTDSGCSQACRDIAREVEQAMVRPRRGPEETRIGRVVGLEAGDEFRPDLVIRLANHRP